ncbi:MAG: response regulator transcription factor [Hellea sp.]|nr:response regulator transcription factor [Hellea sp.]
MVEDDPVIVEHFREIIQEVDHLELVGVANSIAEAKESLRDKTDLVLLDIGLPDGSGLDYLPEIKSKFDCKILIVTTFGDRETVVSAISAGADGYLLKDSGPKKVIEGIDLTMAGGAPISAAAAVYLLDRFREAAANTNNKSPLSQREEELLRLFAKGFKYKEAAKILEISPLTVGNHVKSIYRKLAVNSRSEAVFEAVTLGYIDL